MTMKIERESSDDNYGEHCEATSREIGRGHGDIVTDYLINNVGVDIVRIKRLSRVRDPFNKTGSKPKDFRIQLAN